MASNTLKTVVGFLRGVLERWTPLKPAGQSVEEIYNYVEIDGRFATSGQPNEQQFGLIRDAGYETVINLAPQSVLENSLPNEADELSKLGIRYIHIPVDFKNPTEEDFEQFASSLQEQGTQKIWIHCAANMRVSAFVYRYRRAVLGDSKDVASADLHKIWEPFGIWKSFIANSEDKPTAAE